MRQGQQEEALNSTLNLQRVGGTRRGREGGVSSLFREKAVFLVYFKRAKVRQGVEEKVLLSNEVRAVGAETVVLDAYRAQARQTH